MTKIRTPQAERCQSAPIRVMVVDEHARVRHGLRFFLSTCANIQVVAEAGNASEALRNFVETDPDVVVMHLAAPGTDSAVVTCRMKELSPQSQIIALTNDTDPDMDRRALAAGALCCVLKDSSAGALVAAIYEAQAAAQMGDMTFVQAKTGAMTEEKTRIPSDGKYERLNPLGSFA
jgi:two-component system, NarL family, response regulator LiaR